MKVKFVPQNIECEIKPGQSVLHVAQDNNIYIKSVCRGVPSCAECRVRVVEGDYNVLPPTAAELALIGTAYFIDQRRLSCQLKCFGDITVEMSEQIEKQKQMQDRPVRLQRTDSYEAQSARQVQASLEGEEGQVQPTAEQEQGGEVPSETAPTAQKSAQSTPRQNRGDGGRNRNPRGPRRPQRK